MGALNTLFDYAMTGNWEETQKIQVYRKIRKSKLIEGVEDDKTESNAD